MVLEECRALCEKIFNKQGRSKSMKTDSKQLKAKHVIILEKI